MRYSNYSYLFPPRPDKAISPQLLASIEAQGYHGQIKKNGSCNVLAVTPDKGIIAKTRHKEDHKLWRPDLRKLTAFTGLPGSGWYVFVAELLHSKVPGLRDINYVHDVLVLDGDYLVGVPQVERHRRLCELFAVKGREETYSHWVVDEHTWIAKQFTEGFKAIYDSLDKPEDEGLVLKNPNSPLALCMKATSNSGGMLKARKAHKNYSF
jgi:hypothetical protein